MLNLPAYQITLARNICNTVVTKLCEQNKNFIDTLALGDIGSPTEFVQAIGSHHDELLSCFDEETHGFDGDTVLAARKELCENILAQLYLLFKKYVSLVRKKIVEEFKLETDELISSKKEYIMDSIVQYYGQEKQKFRDIIEAAALVPSWKDLGHLAKLDSHLLFLIDRVKEAAITMNKKSFVRLFKQKLREIFAIIEDAALATPFALKTTNDLKVQLDAKSESIRKELETGMELELKKFFEEKSLQVYNNFLAEFVQVPKIMQLALERYLASFFILILQDVSLDFA